MKCVAVSRNCYLTTLHSGEPFAVIAPRRVHQWRTTAAAATEAINRLIDCTIARRNRPLNRRICKIYRRQRGESFFVASWNRNPISTCHRKISACVLCAEGRRILLNAVTVSLTLRKVGASSSVSYFSTISLIHVTVVYVNFYL